MADGGRCRNRYSVTRAEQTCRIWLRMQKQKKDLAARDPDEPTSPASSYKLWGISACAGGCGGAKHLSTSTFLCSVLESLTLH